MWKRESRSVFRKKDIQASIEIAKMKSEPEIQMLRKEYEKLETGFSKMDELVTELGTANAVEFLEQLKSLNSDSSPPEDISKEYKIDQNKVAEIVVNSLPMIVGYLDLVNAGSSIAIESVMSPMEKELKKENPSALVLIVGYQKLKKSLLLATTNRETEIIKNNLYIYDSEIEEKVEKRSCCILS